jgi:four helix bundle protein
MDSSELKQRTKKFAISIINFLDTLNERKLSSRVIAKQLMRAATSVGANYRAACKGRSKADFISKITIVEEEADECVYWLELLYELEKENKIIINDFIKEAKELTAIFTASGKTAKLNK